MSQAAWARHWGDSFKMVPDTKDVLVSGVYNISENTSGDVIFTPVPQKLDEVFELPGLPIEFVNQQIDKFWANQERYKVYNFVHKRGIILHGPPGNGKTCVIASLVKHLIDQDGIIVNVQEFRLASEALRVLKIVEPERKVMTLIEDMDTLLGGESKTQEQYALSMLDGQAQISGVVHVATTNYPEQLADRFIKRPGRFDLVVGMGMPITSTRRAYFQRILKDNNHPELEYLVTKTEGMALAYLREIASSYLCLGIPVEETVNRLRKNFNGTIKATKAYGHESSLGFKLGYETETEVAQGKG